MRARLTPRVLNGLRADLKALRERESSSRPSWPADPAQFFEACVGRPPDNWQLDVLNSQDARLLLCCARQCGKSTTTAVLALRLALETPKSLTLMLSPSERQSGEIFLKCMSFFQAIGSPLPTAKRTERAVRFGNGSRIISLPGSEHTIRGYSGTNLLILDEAAYTSDALLMACTPMLAVSGGRMIALSTPAGKRGWYSDRWHSGGDDWRRIQVQAADCPRISKGFLAVERRSLGERWYRQEYECSFEDAVGQFFSNEDIESAFHDEQPLFGDSRQNHLKHDDVFAADDEPLFGGKINGNGRSRF
jgi:Terminase large subunit, T4likevirus-type, N-terminal